MLEKVSIFLLGVFIGMNIIVWGFMV